MKMNVHLLMPMGGAGARFFENGYILPKPLIEIAGKPFFYWAVKSVLYSIEPMDITFVVLQQHIDEYHIDAKIKEFFPNAIIKAIPTILPGPVFTAKAGIDVYTDDYPIIINDCDHMFICERLSEQLKEVNNVDGALLTFESQEPQFSYMMYDELGKVKGTIEKVVASKHAICGAYYFRNKEIFESVMEEYIKKCPYKECFISGMYNIMCEKNMVIKDYLLDEHLEFGTPKEYNKARDSGLFDKVEMGK